MKKSIIFLIIAVVGITIWNIPDTTSIFQGQHTFYNGSAPCQKCHQDVQDILNFPNTPQKHFEFGCQGCHIRDGNTSHAASIKQCSDCHIPTSFDVHQINYPQCSDCHINHGTLKDGIGHGNATFIKYHPCSTCHIVRQ